MDPRLPALGLRGVFSSGAPPLVGTADSSTDSDASVASYRKWRYLHGVAEGEQEIESGDCGKGNDHHGLFIGGMFIGGIADPLG